MTMTRVIAVAVIVALTTAAAQAAIVVPWNEERGEYYFFAEKAAFLAPEYDPASVTGTFRKDGDRWIASTWAANTGTWEIVFEGGPTDGMVGTVTINVRTYQVGTSNWCYTNVSFDEGSSWTKFVEMNNNTAYSWDWRGATFGTEEALNVDSLLVRHVMWNGSPGAANVRLGGMEIIATAVPEPTTIGLLALGALGLIRRKRSA